SSRTTAFWRDEPRRRSLRGRRARPRSAVRASSRMSRRRSVASRCSSGGTRVATAATSVTALQASRAIANCARNPGLCQRIGSGPQPVPRAANGDDELRIAARGGELVAQEVDVDVDGARVAELVAAEDRVEQVLAREQPAARAQQRIEDLELGGGEGQLGAVELDPARVRVQ